MLFLFKVESLWECWSQAYLFALEAESLLFICVSFLQKWNAQLIIPASSANAQNLVGNSEKNSANDFFPVEQLQAFTQLVENIHHLEVSGRKVSASSPEDLERSNDFCLCPVYMWVACGLPNSDKAYSPTWGRWVWLLEMFLSLIKGLDNSDSIRFSSTI